MPISGRKSLVACDWLPDRMDVLGELKTMAGDRGTQGQELPCLQTVSGGAGVFDLSIPATLVGDSPELIRELLMAYQSNLESIALEIDRGWQHGNADRVRDAAHQLKSASRSVGALAVGDSCECLELAASEGTLTGLGEHRQDLIEQVRRARAALAELID